MDKTDLPSALSKFLESQRQNFRMLLDCSERLSALEFALTQLDPRAAVCALYRKGDQIQHCSLLFLSRTSDKALRAYKPSSVKTGRCKVARFYVPATADLCSSSFEVLSGTSVHFPRTFRNSGHLFNRNATVPWGIPLPAMISPRVAGP